jgi:5,10-methylenetetrahydromethanopterin reductase
MVHTGDLTMDESIQFAQEAERLSYDGFWIVEESGRESFATLACATSRIQLGTGILNFYSRTPILLAMRASTIYRRMPPCHHGESLLSHPQRILKLK